GTGGRSRWQKAARARVGVSGTLHHAPAADRGARRRAFRDRETRRRRSHAYQRSAAPSARAGSGDPAGGWRVGYSGPQGVGGRTALAPPRAGPALRRRGERRIEVERRKRKSEGERSTWGVSISSRRSAVR